MLTIIATGDRESDLYHWSELTRKDTTFNGHASVDCSSEAGQKQLLLKLETITLLSADVPIVAHFPEVTPQLLSLALSYPQNVYIISPTGKLPKLERTVKCIATKLTDTTIKTLLSEQVRSLGFPPGKDTLQRLFLTLTTEEAGRERLSPLKYLTLSRQLETIKSDDSQTSEKLLSLLLGVTEGKASQWEILSNLFSVQKRTQKEYFSSLAESMNPYEIMAMAKSTVLLVMAILIGQQEHLDQASIAAKLGKNPFYIGSLSRSIQSQRITYPRAQKMITRLLNLELALKSGRFDDESFGFEVLLATL